MKNEAANLSRIVLTEYRIVSVYALVILEYEISKNDSKTTIRPVLVFSE